MSVKLVEVILFFFRKACRWRSLAGFSPNWLVWPHRQKIARILTQGVWKIIDHLYRNVDIDGHGAAAGDDRR